MPGSTGRCGETQRLFDAAGVDFLGLHIGVRVAVAMLSLLDKSRSSSKAVSALIDMLPESSFAVEIAAVVFTTEKHSLMLDRDVAVLFMFGFKVEVGGSAIISAVRNVSGQIVAKACAKSL